MRDGCLIHLDDPLQDDRAIGIEVRSNTLKPGAKAITCANGDTLTYINPERNDPFEVCNLAAHKLGLKVEDDPAAWQRVLAVRERYRKDDEAQRAKNARR